MVTEIGPYFGLPPFVAKEAMAVGAGFGWEEKTGSEPADHQKITRSLFFGNAISKRNPLKINWRSGRDSNPRYSYPYASLAKMCFRPLSHRSRCLPADGFNHSCGQPSTLRSHRHLLPPPRRLCARAAQALRRALRRARRRALPYQLVCRHAGFVALGFDQLAVG